MSDKHIPAARPLIWNKKVLVGTPIGIGEMFEHANYCRAIYLAEQRERLNGLPESIAEKAWERADSFADKIVPGTEQYGVVCQWVDAQYYLVWLAFKKKQPSLTLDECKQLLVEQYPDVIAMTQEMAGNHLPKDGVSAPLADAVAAVTL